MKNVALVVVTLFFSLFTNAQAQPVPHEHYLFRYETGDTYEVIIDKLKILWYGVEGADQGVSETDVIKRKMLSKNVEVFQWTENSGQFVTLILNRKARKVISSGKTADGNWFATGNVTIMAVSDVSDLSEKVLRN